MELSSLENLEKRVSKLLENYRSVTLERDELTRKVDQLNIEVSNLSQANREIQTKLLEAQRNARDLEAEQRARSKVDELLEKLEGF